MSGTPAPDGAGPHRTARTARRNPLRPPGRCHLRMAEADDLIRTVLKGEVGDMIGAEDLVMEAFRDILRDEIKAHVRQRLDANPQLRAELKDAVGAYFEAKAQEAVAGLRMTRLGAKLGVELLPDHLKREISEELMGIVEEEVGKILARSV